MKIYNNNNILLLYMLIKEKYLKNDRTVFNFKTEKQHYLRTLLGFLIFLILFIILIPIILIKYKYYLILLSYFSNVDLIATVLGYHGGPMDTFIWKHLYNPGDSTIEGYVMVNIINFFALLGLIYAIVKHTLSTQNIYLGMSRAAIMLLITYLIPGNFIILLMNNFGNYINKYFKSESLLHYLLVALLGMFSVITIIFFEIFITKQFLPYLSSSMKYLTKMIY